MKSQDVLKLAVLSASESQEWNEAKREWEHTGVIDNPHYQTCLCGHYPIRDVCVIENRLNDRVLEIGNCCIKQFLGVDLGRVFRSLHRLADNITCSASDDLLSYAVSRNVLNDWEYLFYCDIKSIRHLSVKQSILKYKLNERIYKHFYKKRVA